MDGKLRLVIADRNYSSWSLRAYLALELAGLAYETEFLQFNLPDWKERVRALSPAGKVPALLHETGGRAILVHESLAICQYVARLAPEARLWPESDEAFACCASICSEMHAGFGRLRGAMPMNIRKDLAGKGMGPGVRQDIDRIDAIWTEARIRFGAGGPLLFGRPSMADAMYAPVASRFRTYGVSLSDTAAAYRDAVLSLPPMQRWIEAACAEPWIVPEDEIE